MTIPGTAIYMSRNPHGIAPALIHNLKHNKILHKQVIVLTIVFDKVPRVNLEQNMEIENPTDGFYKVVAHYGFIDSADINDIIKVLNQKGIQVKIQKTTFFLGREALVPNKRKGFGTIRDKIFILLSNNAQRATDFFNIPPHRVFEVGTQVEL
jgi:KUP system potassium uptake protein